MNKLFLCTIQSRQYNERDIEVEPNYYQVSEELSRSKPIVTLISDEIISYGDHTVKPQTDVRCLDKHGGGGGGGRCVCCSAVSSIRYY